MRTSSSRIAGSGTSASVSPRPAVCFTSAFISLHTADTHACVRGKCLGMAHGGRSQNRTGDQPEEGPDAGRGDARVAEHARVLYTRYCAFELSTPIFASPQRLARAVHIRLPRGCGWLAVRGAQSQTATRGDFPTRVPPTLRHHGLDGVSEVAVRGGPPDGPGLGVAVCGALPVFVRVHRPTPATVDPRLRVSPGGRVAQADAVHAPPGLCAHLSTGGKGA